MNKEKLNKLWKVEETNQGKVAKCLNVDIPVQQMFEIVPEGILEKVENLRTKIWWHFLWVSK